MFGARLPIVQAPMMGAAGGRLAGAVARAGGLGFIGAGHERSMSPNVLRQEYDAALRERGPGVSAVGVGFVVDFVSDEDKSFAESLRLQPPPAAIWLAFGSDKAFATLISRAHGADIKVMVQVNTVSEAKRVHKIGADAIVLQSRDAGGHGKQATAGSYTAMVPELRQHVGPEYPILAAGGIVDGNGLAAALSAGADAAVLGTRFAVCTESIYPERSKRALLAAASNEQSHVSGSWDLFNPAGWPEQYQARALEDECYRRFDFPLTSPRPQLTDADRQWFKDNAPGNKPVYAGAGVALVTEEDSAEHAVSATMKGAEIALARASRILAPPPENK